MIKTIRYILLPALLVLAACTGNPGRRAAAGLTDAGDVAEARADGAPVQDSVGLLRAAERFWDGFEYTAAASPADSAGLERAFAVWADLLTLLPQEQAAPLTGALIARGNDAPAMQLYLGELAERYLDDPNSPYRSEELYIPVLEALTAAPHIDEVYKLRPRAQLMSARKNRPGTRAADIAYATKEGGRGTLRSLGAEYTLLLFYNPGCSDCGRVEAYIARSRVFSPLITSGRMKVLALYPDEDLDEWRKHLHLMPAEWTVGYAPVGHTADSPYDLPAIPCLYLLGRDKTVIFKDAPVERIESWLCDKNDQ